MIEPLQNGSMQFNLITVSDLKLLKRYSCCRMEEAKNDTRNQNKQANIRVAIWFNVIGNEGIKNTNQ